VLRGAAPAADKYPDAVLKTAGEGVGSICEFALVEVLPVILIHLFLYLYTEISRPHRLKPKLKGLILACPTTSFPLPIEGEGILRLLNRLVPGIICLVTIVFKGKLAKGFS
jgi:hypothetical protein